MASRGNMTGKEKEGEAKAGSAPKKLPVPARDPSKIEVIQNHRQFVANGPGGLLARGLNVMRVTSGETSCTGFKTTVPPGLKPMYVNGIDTDMEWVYAKRILRLTLIEDPMFGFVATNVVGRDAKGDVIRVSIYDIPQTEGFGKLLAFGTELGIISPYFRVAMDLMGGLRVEDPTNEIVHLGRKEKMCRYCWEENSTRMCAKCKVNYCSRECQLADWKVLNHKVICWKK